MMIDLLTEEAKLKIAAFDEIKMLVDNFTESLNDLDEDALRNSGSSLMTSCMTGITCTVDLVGRLLDDDDEFEEDEDDDD